MNITRENLDNLTSVLRATVVEADYAEAVDKSLRQYKRKASVPGFRPGMVPMGVINKMYRKGVVAEESYKLASQGCIDYLDKEKISIIGDLMPSDLQKPLDVETQSDFEFVFEFGVSPEVNVTLSDKDKVTMHQIKIDKSMRDGYRSNFLRRFGQLVDVEVVEKDEAINVTLDNTEMQIEEAYVGLISMSDEERKPFIGKKVGDTMEVDVNELYKTAEQRASILQVKEDELADINPKFKLTITKIRKFAEPEINDEFFKMAFPAGDITDAKAFETFVEEQIAKELERESEFLFNADLRTYLLKKANLTLPEEFLKRWLFSINEGRFSMEEIERDFAPFIEMMKWQLIQKHFVNTLNIEITQEDTINEAKETARLQFAQYGMNQVEDEMLTNYARQMMENREESKKIFDRVYENKVLGAVKPLIKVDTKSVSVEEFGKLVDQMNSK